MDVLFAPIPEQCCGQFSALMSLAYFFLCGCMLIHVCAHVCARVYVHCSRSPRAAGLVFDPSTTVPCVLVHLAEWGPLCVLTGL